MGWLSDIYGGARDLVSELDPTNLLDKEGDGKVGLVGDHNTESPEGEMDELRRAFRAYTTSSIYEGDAPKWVSTKYGAMPIGGLGAIGPENEESRESQIFKDYVSAYTNVLDRITKQSKYGDYDANIPGWSEDYGPRTFAPDSPLSDDELGAELRSYILGRGYSDDTEWTPPEEYQIDTPQTGNASQSPMSPPGSSPTYQDQGQSQSPRGSYFDYSKGNPFADHARSMGFTDFQGRGQSPQVEQQSIADSLRGTPPTPAPERSGSAGRFSGGPSTFDFGALVNGPSDKGALTQTMQAAALRGAGDNNG